MDYKLYSKPNRFGRLSQISKQLNVDWNRILELESNVDEHKRYIKICERNKHKCDFLRLTQTHDALKIIKSELSEYKWILNEDSNSTNTKLFADLYVQVNYLLCKLQNFAPSTMTQETKLLGVKSEESKWLNHLNQESALDHASLVEIPLSQQHESEWRSLLFGISRNCFIDICRTIDCGNRFCPSLRHEELYKTLIDITCLKDQKLIRKMKKLTFLDHYELKIDNTIVKGNYLNLFLEKCFPKNVRTLTLEAESNQFFNITRIFNPLVKASYRITDKILISRMRISQRQYQKLLVANRNTGVVGLHDCHLLITTVLKFGQSMKGATIKTLDFSKCGHRSVKNRLEAKNIFELILQGISECPDLKACLELVDFKEGRLFQRDIIVLREKHDLIHVKYDC
ncbi:unnamed protein product [Moneuplotes crassus]|uniref:Uncharacterized protein n=1 Tax=Euplotes crassus TaxID=5936 RepID=A0AAD1U3Q9_EUPCR|nr:unnamed protein product [Moneuplotes crassus]